MLNIYYKNIISRALPCTIEQFLLIFVNVANTAIVGRLSKEILAATAMTNQLVSWFQLCYLGLSMGTTVLVARLKGENDTASMNKTIVQSITLTAVISFTMLIICLVFQKGIIGFFYGSSEQAVKDQINIYFNFAVLGLPFMGIMTVINGCFRGMGNNRLPLFISFVLNIVNAGTSYILIYGFDLGIKGAGIAVFVAKLLASFIALLFIYKYDIRFSFKKMFETKIIKRILNVGLPSLLEQGMFQTGFLVVQIILVGFGTVVQAGYQITTSIRGLIDAPSLALGIAMTTLVSETLGTKNFDDVKKYIKAGRIICLCFFTVLNIIMFIFSPNLISIFTSDPTVHDSATVFLKYLIGISIIINFNQLTTGIMRGMGDIKYVAISVFFGLWLIRIGGMWVISKYLGTPYQAIIISMFIDFSVRLILYNRRISKGKYTDLYV